ncbi:MAG: phosphomannose isomerase type II C-terminal cupin domain [Proteobacteria bacterium]|nr:phosphomannose isomerase type II C-terminal cupin domain [Pseudomonadota bacterium]
METDYRPWGHYSVLADEPDHKVKRIVVYPGRRFSLQRHLKRDEHWYVVSGTGAATLDKDEVSLGPGRALDVPRRTVHRLRNTGPGDLVFIEIQIGDYFGEDDIERVEDDYGRA